MKARLYAKDFISLLLTLKWHKTKHSKQNAIMNTVELITADVTKTANVSRFLTMIIITFYAIHIALY